MFFEDLFFWLDLRLVAAILAGGMLLAAEACFRLGRWRHADDSARSQFATIEGAALAVVGLLLAFTFSMAVSRFESRKQIVVNETNALGTAWLRTQLLPQPDRSQAQAALRRYVDVWLALHPTGRAWNPHDPAGDELDRLQAQIWEQVSGLARQSPTALTLSLLLQALNDVFDRQGEFQAALANRVPGVVLLLLTLTCTAAIGIVGCGCGLAGSRNFGVTLVLAGMLIAVILVILDLDRPARGHIQLNLQSMIALRQSMGEPPP